MTTNHSASWANPAPAGLVALAVACFIFFALLSGRVDAPGALPMMGCWLIGGFIVQVFVAVIELREGALTGGNVFLFFSGFFMLTGGISFFVKYHLIINKMPLDARLDGWAWIVLSMMLFAYTFVYLKESSKVMGLLLIILTVSAFFVAFLDLGVLDASYKPIPAWGLLATGICGMYQAMAIAINSAYKRTILPVGTPFLANK